MQTQYQYQKHRLLRGFLLLFVSLTCVRVWIGPTTVIKAAQAQIPDAGLQRKQMLEETRRTNELLTQIVQLLKDHTFNVRMLGADNQADAPGKRHSDR